MNNTVKPFHEQINMMSKISLRERFFIKTNLLPVKIDNDDGAVSFKLMSWRTLIQLILLYSPFYGTAIVWAMQPEFVIEYCKTCFELYVPFELLFYMSYFVVSAVGSPLTFLSIADPFCQLQEISIEAGLKTKPIFNWEMGVALVCMYAGFLAQSIGHYMLVSPQMENFDEHTKLLNIVGRIFTKRLYTVIV